MGAKPVTIMEHEIGEESRCSEHPDRANPSGICAFCLQEKLGNLISSKSPDTFFSNPPHPPFPPLPPSETPIPFFPTRAPRSKTKTLIPAQIKNKTPVKGFWSFLAPSFDNPKRSSVKCAAKEEDASTVDGSPSESQGSSSSGRRIARSRSVGCGSRSFSGDFFERISNGLGDCALRRAESHREAKPKPSGDVGDKRRRIKERVWCRGIFAGFGMMSFSTYWISATADSGDFGEPGSFRPTARGGRSKSLAWAFASPLRALRAAGGGEGGRSPFIAGGGGRGRVHGSVVSVRRM